MRALFYQPSCGISGDMHMAAMFELGVPQTLVREELARLPLADQYQIDVAPAEKMGISGTRVAVGTSEQHHHRHHYQIVEMIKGCGYAPGVERRALDIFERIAVAEAKIHNVPVAKVHFHEVGAVDSIVDIVAAAVCLEHLNVDRVYCNPVEVGAGHVNCAHGRFPVPAPATQELLTGVPCSYGGVQGESTTPTGAAILRATVTHFEPPAAFAPARIGYGIGHKDFELPNVLRVALGDVSEQEPAPIANTASTPIEQNTHYRHYKIEANIDDMSPEAFEPLLQSLFEAGAGDAWCTSIVMKKSRSATCLSVIADSSRVNALADLVLNQSTTIGLRILPFEKRILRREELVIDTSHGPIRVKRVTLPNGDTRWKSEHDDVASFAATAKQDYLSAKKKIDFEIEQVLRSDPGTP